MIDISKVARQPRELVGMLARYKAAGDDAPNLAEIDNLLRTYDLSNEFVFPIVVEAAVTLGQDEHVQTVEQQFVEALPRINLDSDLVQKLAKAALRLESQAAVTAVAEKIYRELDSFTLTNLVVANRLAESAQALGVPRLLGRLANEVTRVVSADQATLEESGLDIGDPFVCLQMAKLSNTMNMPGIRLTIINTVRQALESQKLDPYDTSELDRIAKLAKFLNDPVFTSSLITIASSDVYERNTRRLAILNDLAGLLGEQEQPYQNPGYASDFSTLQRTRLAR